MADGLIPFDVKNNPYLEFVEVFFKLVGSHGPFVGTVLHKSYEKGRLLKADTFMKFFQHQPQLQSFFELKRKRKQWVEWVQGGKRQKPSKFMTYHDEMDGVSFFLVEVHNEFLSFQTLLTM